MDTVKRFERILLATDGSEASRAAVDATIAIAKSPTVKVKVAHAWSLEVHHRHGYWDVEVHSEAARLIDQTVARLMAAGVIAQREIIRADSKHVAAAIAVSAREFDADLVVVGSRGLSDWQSLIQHSVSHELLCAVDCPVLIVRGVPTTPFQASKILLAIAGGDDLAPAVRAALAVAGPGAKAMVLHVAQEVYGSFGYAYVEPAEEIQETMAKACGALEDAGLEVEGIVGHNEPVAKTVADVARNWNASLIVVGSSRLGDMGSLLLGSVSHELLHVADRPVLVAARS